MAGKRRDKVYELDLHGKKLTRIEGLEKFATLRVLDLSCNLLHRIEGLDKNRDLRELKLYGNRITSLSGLESLSELCHLQLQHNLVKQIGKSLCNLKKLQILRFDHNLLEIISANEIAACGGHMTHLDLSCNRLTAVHGLDTMTNLEELKVASNRLTALPSLSRCKKLTELDISSNPLAPKALLKLENRQLKILRVEGLHLKGVASSLPKLNHLEELYAADNELSSVGDVPSHYPMLEVLDVRQNVLRNVDDLKSLDKLHSLCELLLESNPLCSTSDNYRMVVRELLPQLELIDGVSSTVAMGVGGGASRTVPLMRPLTPSSIGPSLHQMGHQLLEVEVQLENYTSGLTSTFEMLRCQPVADSSWPPHECKGHQREEDDSTLLSQESGCDELKICDSNDGTRSDEGRLSSCSSSRPSTRGSSRARIKEALVFASENFGKLNT